MYNLFLFEVTPGKESVKCLARYCCAWNNHCARVRKKNCLFSKSTEFSSLYFLMWEKIKRQP